ncbi:hypothetical protein B9M93_26380 [Escherichia coli]|nr:hypothetical protein B9M93_26380 [Escherichia coli]RBW23378.1 hypothetical protein B9M92_26510 [Escherichia coli]
MKKNVKPKYGDAAFLEYTRLIVNHPNYFGMPDPFGEKGEIQWEAPSNRASGKFKLKWFTEFGHLNRGDMLTSEQHRCHNEKKKFQRRV